MTASRALSGSIVLPARLAEWSDFECKFVTLFRGGGWAVEAVLPSGRSGGRAVVGC
jgi:hypothetical protein